MNLHHALTVEKMTLSHIEGYPIDNSFKIIIESKEYTFYDSTSKLATLSYTFDGLEELLRAPSGPGFYLLTDKNSNEQVIIELKQSLSATIR